MEPDLCPYCKAPLNVWRHKVGDRVSCIRCTKVLGYYVRCTFCQTENWYPTTQTSTLRCRQCKAELLAPSASPDVTTAKTEARTSPPSAPNQPNAKSQDDYATDPNGNVAPESRSPAPLRTKLLFWLLLTALSGLLVEVGRPSSPWLFFTKAGLLVTCPLYGLHLLVLAYIAFLSPRLRWSLLFVCGSLLGLYESYLTKAIWAPTSVGIHPFQASVLLFMVHPFLAFILPLLAVELFYTHSTEIAEGAPKPIRAVLASSRGRLAAALCLALYLGVYHALAPVDPHTWGGPPAGAFSGAFDNTLVVAFLGFWWRSIQRDRPPTMRQLLPDRRQFVVLAVLLGLLYIVGALLLHPKAMPHTLPPHLIILGLYAVLIVLLWRNIRFGQRLGPPEQRIQSAYQDSGPLTLFLFVFPITSALFTWIRPIAGYIIFTSWIAGTLAGVALLCLAARDAFAKGNASSQTTEKSPSEVGDQV